MSTTASASVAPVQTQRRALSPTEIVTQLAQLSGWSLDGDGNQVAIYKTYTFSNYYETIAFVNAIAYVAHQQDHHPDLGVHYNRCQVRLNTHDVGGITTTDFASAGQYDALYAKAP